jgi:galactose oxidase-like protein/glyoxal oxidase-like protein/Kelch motif protein
MQMFPNIINYTTNNESRGGPLKATRDSDVLSFPADSLRSIHEQRFPMAPAHGHNRQGGVLHRALHAADQVFSMSPGKLKQQVALFLTLLSVGWLAPTAAYAQSVNPTFRSATAATLVGAVNFRAASSAATTSGTLVVARPASTVKNDVMIASIGVRSSTATITAPAGWTLVRRVNNSRASANALAVYRKVAGAVEPDSYSWTLARSTHAVGGIQSFSGVDTASPINVEGGRATTSALTHPTSSLTTTVTNTVVVTAHTFSSAANWSPPAGMTEGFDIATPAPPNSTGQAIEGNWVRQAAAGATGIKTATASSHADGGNTHILALRPAANVLSIRLPAEAVANDVMIASIGVRPSTAAITSPEGWTLVRRIVNANPSANSLAVYRKVATAEEPASYAWGIAGASFAVGGIQAFFGVDTANPIDVENGQATASALGHSTPSVTTTVANTMVVTSHTFASSRTWATPSGMAESFDQPSGAASSNGQSIAGNRVLQGAAGATGVKTATAAGDADAGNTHILALRPAVSAPDPRASVGQWTGPVSLPIVGVHMHLLPDGTVLAWGVPEATPLDGKARERVWDPTLEQPVFQEVPNPFVDVYCSGHSFLADGRLLVAGGHIQAFVGSDATTVFDFRTRTWSDGPRMSAARWYPTNTTLANGEVAIVSGAIDGETRPFNALPEVWSAATGLRPLNDAQLELTVYPWLHLAPNGRVFNSGPGQTTRYLDTQGTGSWTVVALTNFGDRRHYEGTSVMYEPGKVLIVGGGSPATATAEVIDLNAAAPQWQYTNSMRFARRYLNATTLPDGKVLVTGGSTSDAFGDPRGAVYDAEMWDPATGSWSTLAAMSVRRVYHSTAVLLPDGRVLTAGGQDAGGLHYDAEYYSPPYLFFEGARPTIGSAPESAGYGETFTVGTTDAVDIAKVTLVGLSSSTHEFNQNQRFVSLVFSPTPDGTGLSVTVPSNPNIAPPGYYMLFILNSAGVPSVAKMVRVAAPEIALPAQ